MFTDRVSQYPNRKKLKVKDNGGNSALPLESEIIVDMDYADNPSVTGTPLNAENLNKSGVYCIVSCNEGMQAITNKQWNMDSI